MGSTKQITAKTKTMRIEELSVGDWVKYEFPEMGKKAVQVSSIDAEDNHIGTESVGASAWSYTENFSPIPLTPEILERNGLCVVEEDADFSEYELFGSENFSIFHTKGTLRYRLETPQASVVCWFVHQLQHALRLAEVEKEIVL